MYEPYYICLQVRELAASTLSGLAHCGYIQDIDKLKVSITLSYTCYPAVRDILLLELLGCVPIHACVNYTSQLQLIYVEGHRHLYRPVCAILSTVSAHLSACPPPDLFLEF